MKRLAGSLLFTLIALTSHSQDSLKLPTLRLGIFAPLYLDSSFTSGGAYKYTKSFPKFSLPGLDFVQGAMIALDSMPLYGGNLDATFFDSKSSVTPVNVLISQHKLDSLDMIIGAVKDPEYVQLAEFARLKNIPFISATYPNDGGITDNPFTIIVNSTLRAHCEAIFAYLLQSHGSNRIFLVRRPGSQEDKVAAYFKALNNPDGKPLLNIQTINITSDDFSALGARMDSTKENIVIGGTLNEGFATKIAAYTSSISRSYPNSLIGMPNWDAFRFMVSKGSSFKDYPILYTTPYYNYKWDQTSKYIQSAYRRKYKSTPSDMAYKGYETVFLFGRLLTRYPSDVVNHLNDYAYKVFSEYRFRPVFQDKNDKTPDYFENKRLYFIRALNGSFSKAW